MKLAIITTHPVQYYAPLFRKLTERNRIQIKVFYTWEQGTASFDKGFGKELTWDIPLLDGYEYEFVSNNGSPRKDFMGVKNPGLRNAISSWGADAVLVFGWNYFSHLQAMRHFKGRIPVWFRGDSNMLDQQGQLKGIARKCFLRWVYSFVDRAFFVGTNNKAYYKAYGLDEKQLIFAPHAIENKRFEVISEEDEDFIRGTRQQLGLNKPGITLLYVGKFQSKKDPALLMDAVLQLNDPSVRLLMVGNGELEDQLKEKAAGATNIMFLPFQNQSRMPAVYRLGDVFCLPSKGPGETWGLAVNEAMACGKPVLVSNKVGCAVDLVQQGVNGFVFSSGDMADLSEKIRSLKTANLREMGLASSIIIAEWTIEKISEKLEIIQLNHQ